MYFLIVGYIIWRGKSFIDLIFLKALKQLHVLYKKIIGQLRKENFWQLTGSWYLLLVDTSDNLIAEH